MKLNSPGITQRKLSTAHAALRELSDDELVTLLTTYLRGHPVAQIVVSSLTPQLLFKSVRK